MLKKIEAGAALLLTLLSLGFAARFLGHAGPLWRDEAATLNFASQPGYGDLVRSLDFMSLPLLYPTILRGWSGLGWTDADFAVRLLGFLVTVAVLATTWLGTRSLGLGPPLLTLAFFGLHGVVLGTAALVRPYGLGTLAVIGASCAMLRFVLSPGRATFAIAVIFATLAVQTQYQNALFVAVICLAGALAALDERDWKRAAFAAAPGAMAALSLLPYLGVLSRGQEWRSLHRSVTDEPLGSVLRRMSDILTLQSGFTLLLWMATIALACYGAGRSLIARPTGRVGHATMIYAASTLLGGFAVFLAFFGTAGRIVQPWHAMPLIGLLALSLDMVFAQPMWQPGTRLAIASVGAALMVPAAMAMTSVRQTNVDLHAALLERRAAPQDLIVVNPWFLGITLERYYHGKARVLTIPPMRDLRLHRYDELRTRMMELDPLRSLENAVADTLQAGHRVWVLGEMPIASQSPPSLPPAPHPVTGWSDATYALGWSLQMGHFLGAHAERVHRVDIAVHGPVNPYENVQMLTLEGWRR